MSAYAENQIVSAVLARGGAVYLVGGAVRDGFLGQPSKDKDYLVTGLSVDELGQALGQAGFKVDLVGKSFGVVKATMNGETFDLALPRRERSTGAGHKDFEVQVDPRLPVEEDLSRRDFTVNAMALRLPGRQLVDPFEGKRDLGQKVLCAVGQPFRRFEEDPLRMLRAVRFMAKLGFMIDHGTLNGMAEHAKLIETVAPERVQEELFRMLSYDNSEGTLKALMVFELTKLFEHALKPHKFTATAKIPLRLVERVVAKKGSLLARLGAFFHATPDPVGVLERLKASKAVTDSVGRLGDVVSALLYNDEALEVRRAMVRAGSAEVWEAALTVIEADLTLADDLESPSAYVNNLRAKASGLEWLFDFAVNKVPITGPEVEAEFGVTGKFIGHFKKLAFTLIVDGKAENTRDSVVSALKADVAQYGLDDAVRRLSRRGL